MSTVPASSVLLTATAALLLLSACGGASSGSSSSGDRSSASGGATAGQPSSASAAPSSSTAPEDLVVAPSGRLSVLTGTVEAGVEAGCLLLQASGVLHQLVGETQGLAPGQRVTVRGRSRPALLTTCQQGTPFVVSSSAPA